MQTWFVKSHWLEQDKIAYIEIIGDFTAEGMMEFNHHWVGEFLDKGQAPVHTIIDASGLTGYPKSLSVLRQGSNVSTNHPNIGWVIMVGFGSNPVLKFLSSAVTQLFSVKFKQVESIYDAKDILRRMDNQLSELA